MNFGSTAKTVQLFGGWEKVWSGGCTGRRKKSSFISGKMRPGQGHHETNHMPCPGWYNIRRMALSFLAKVGPPEGSRDSPAEAVPCPARLLPALTAAVLGSCPVEMLWSSLPTRCSRDTAMVAVFRLASSHPDTEPVPPQGAIPMRPSGPTERRNRARR